MPNDSVLMLGTIPGSRPIKPMKLRLIDGNSTSSVAVMLPPTSFDVTSTMGSQRSRSATSSSAPTASSRSSVSRLADFEPEIAGGRTS